MTTTCLSCSKEKCDRTGPLTIETEADMHHLDYFCHGHGEPIEKVMQEFDWMLLTKEMRTSIRTALRTQRIAGAEAVASSIEEQHRLCLKEVASMTDTDKNHYLGTGRRDEAYKMLTAARRALDDVKAGRV